jgi:hypothetical protein
MSRAANALFSWKYPIFGAVFLLVGVATVFYMGSSRKQAPMQSPIDYANNICGPEALYYAALRLGVPADSQQLLDRSGAMTDRVSLGKLKDLAIELQLDSHGKS